MPQKMQINLFGNDESTQEKTNRVELVTIRYTDTPAGTMEIESVAVPMGRIDKHKAATSVFARRMARTVKSVHLIAAKGVNVSDDSPKNWQTPTYAILTLDGGKTSIARLRYDRELDKYVIRPLREYPATLAQAKTVAEYRIALMFETLKIHNRNKRKPTIVIEGFSFVR